MTAMTRHDLVPPKGVLVDFVTPRREVKILFPLLQLAIMCSLAVMVAVPSAWTKGLFAFLLIAWQVSLSTRLALESWRSDLHICSTEATLSVVAAAWYGGLGLALGVPAAATVMALALITVALYGWLCHDRRR